MTNEDQVKQHCVAAAEAVVNAAKEVVGRAESKVTEAGKAVTDHSATLDEAVDQVRVAGAAARKAALLATEAITAKAKAAWKALVP